MGSSEGLRASGERPPLADGPGAPVLAVEQAAIPRARTLPERGAGFRRPRCKCQGEDSLCARPCRGLFLGLLTRKVLFGRCASGKKYVRRGEDGQEAAAQGEALRTVS